MTNQHKIVLLGPAVSGKTQFVRKVLDLPFEKRYTPTLGCEISQLWQYIFWDIADRAASDLMEMYCVNAACALVFFPKIDEVGRAEAHHWIEQVRKVNPATPVVVVRSKADLECPTQTGVAADKEFDKYTPFVYDMSSTFDDSAKNLLEFVRDIIDGEFDEWKDATSLEVVASWNADQLKTITMPQDPIQMRLPRL